MATERLLEIERLDDFEWTDFSKEGVDAGLESRKCLSDCSLRGKRLLQEHQWSQAVLAISEAISSDDSNSSLYADRAVASLALGDYECAEEDCTKAWELNESTSFTLLMRSLARKHQEKFIDACLDLLHFMDLHTDFESTASVVRKEYDTVMSLAIRELIDLIAENHDKSCKRGEIEKIRNVLSEKEKYFGNDLLLKKQFGQAIVKYNNAIRLTSNDPTFYANRALCWIGLKRYKEAELDCTKALSFDSGYVKVFIRRARLRDVLGNLKGARDDYLSALNLDRENGPVYKELRRIISMIKTERKNNKKKNMQSDLLQINIEAREEIERANSKHLELRKKVGEQVERVLSMNRSES